MDVWKDLRTALADLADRDPSPLRAWPGFSEKVAATPRPYSIWLAAWAADVAEQLHQRYGADVELKLGALCYPDRRYPQHMAVQEAERRKSTPVPRIDETEISVALDGPVSVRSGYTTTCRSLVGNLTADELTFVMGPLLVADVVDPGTGDIVGGYSGLMDLMRGGFAVPSGGTTPVPLLVATDSFDPDLGYAVPPGEWAIQVTLSRITERDPVLGRPSRTPILPLTVTA